MILTDIIFVEDLIVFVFRIVNFGIFLSLFGYGFKLYGLPVLKESYQAHYDYFDHLIHSHATLLQESNDIDRIKERDKQEQEILKKRVMQWKQVVDTQRARMQEKQEKQRLALNDRLHIQQEKIKEYRLKAQVMPLAIADARNRLIELATKKQFQDAMMQKTKTILRKVH